jgi:hypothetical protein
MRTANRTYILDAIEAILEDITGCVGTVPLNNHLEHFFDEDEFLGFKNLMAEEFDLPDHTLLDSAQTFRELIVLLEDELF